MMILVISVEIVSSERLSIHLDQEQYEDSYKSWNSNIRNIKKRFIMMYMKGTMSREIVTKSFYSKW